MYEKKMTNLEKKNPDEAGPTLLLTQSSVFVHYFFDF